MGINRFYPNTSIKLLPGDIIYSSIGLSTYLVGHSVILGSDFLIYEVIPGKPGWHRLTLEQHWNRHRPGDVLTILRSPVGAREASSWITKHISQFKKYHLTNYDIENFSKSYCYKFVVQVYYHGAGVMIVNNPHRLLLPNDIKKSPFLERIAIISKS